MNILLPPFTYLAEDLHANETQVWDSSWANQISSRCRFVNMNMSPKNKGTIFISSPLCPTKSYIWRMERNFDDDYQNKKKYYEKRRKITKEKKDYEESRAKIYEMLKKK